MRTPDPLGMLRFISAWLVPWRDVFRARAGNSGLSFYVHRKDYAGRHIAKYGTYEPALTDWIARHLSTAPEGLFIDVGANLGWHCIHAARHRSVQAVVAFEPDARNAWLLDRNLSLNGVDRATLVASAVGAQTGLAKLHRYKNSNLGRHSVLHDHGHGHRSVPMTDLDSAIAALGLSDRRVLILKIDVEGYEPAVIEGAARTLERTDVVIVEHSPHLNPEGGKNSVLEGAGFRPHELCADGRLKVLAHADLRHMQGQMDVIWTR